MVSTRLVACVIVAMTTLVFVSGAASEESEGNLHCMPGQPCWPTFQEFMNFTQSLKGDVLFASDKNYRFVYVYDSENRECVTV